MIIKRKKRFKIKKRKRESRIEFKKLLGMTDKIGKNISNKSSNIFDNVIRFAGFALLGVVLKNLDKIFTFAKTIIDKIKEYAIQFKNYFDNILLKRISTDLWCWKDTRKRICWYCQVYY